MSTPSEATPRPWRAVPSKDGGVIQILAQQGPVTVCVAEVNGGPSDADLVVRSANSHDDLLFAAKGAAIFIKEMLASGGRKYTDSPTLMRLLRAIESAADDRP